MTNGTYYDSAGWDRELQKTFYYIFISNLIFVCNILTDREIKYNDVDQVTTQPKPLVSQGDGNAYIREFQDDPLKHRRKKLQFLLMFTCI